MIKHLKLLLEPFNSIKDQPYHFIVWLLVAIVLGSSGLWLPPLLVYFKNGDAVSVIKNYIYAGGLSTLSIVILADGIASNLVTVKAGSNILAAGIRGIAGSLALVLVLIQVGVLIIETTTINAVHISLTFHLVITFLAIVISSYLYCFKFPSWEKGVDTVREKEDKEVNELAKSAEAKTADEEGVKL